MSAFRLTILLFGAQLAERCGCASQPEPTILPAHAHFPRVAVNVLVRDPNLASDVCCIARERECGELCMMDGVESFSCLAIPSDPMAGDLCSSHCTCNGPVTQ